MSGQLVLDVPGWNPIYVVPTIAMGRGDQSVVQCSECACVVVQPRPIDTGLGICPCCQNPKASWWRQYGLPLAGLTTNPDQEDR